MSFKQKVQELKRELLLEEATNLFIRDGYENMKIAELAKNAEVSIGSIYAMFGSKEALYNNYLMGQIDYYMEIIEKEFEKHTDPIKMLIALTEIKFSAIIKNRNAVKESFSDPTFFLNVSLDDDNPLMQMYKYIAEQVMKPLSQIVHTKKNPLEMFFIYDGITFGRLRYWLVTGGDLMSSVDDTVDSFLAVIEKG
jgi:AcrR family transcriptional regulator